MGLSGRPAYKIWPTNDGRGNQGHGSGPTHSSTTAVHREGGATMDLRMRKGRRADLPIIWPATLQTAWDDLPEDERKGLDRQAWERHFRKKIEQYVEGNRTERWVAEGPSGEFLGYVIIGESGFLTPEVHAFLYDIWVAPDHRGKGIGQALVEWAGDWARRRGHRKIKLEVGEGNGRARHVYEKLGFIAERRYMGKPLP
ncbi:MAG: GNAT family N-acetyltransferase [Methanobacteriota archaeon]|nr:MAG: GNAT family N-acetyltransferase [Euryarchaeota archaeon]